MGRMYRGMKIVWNGVSVMGAQYSGTGGSCGI